MTSIMDMYSILGVKPTSSLQDVRKAYIDLARICHPDKGGQVEDMRVLKTTYDWICNQLQFVALESEKGTFDEREADYQAYIKQHENDTATPLPSIVEIELSMYVSNSETFTEIQKRICDRFPTDTFMRDICLRRVCFHKDREDLLHILDNIIDDVDAIQQQGSIPASIPGGYGDMLDLSHDPCIHHPSPPEQTQTLTSFGRMELVLHNPEKLEPAGGLVVHRVPVCAEIPIPLVLDDYSVGASLSDYRAAYTDTTHASRQLEDMYNSNGAFTHTYDGLVETRKQQDDMFQSSIKEQFTLTFKNM